MMDYTSSFGLSSPFDDWSCSIDDIFDAWILPPDDDPFSYAGSCCLDGTIDGPAPFAPDLPTRDSGSHASSKKRSMGYSLDDFLRAGKMQERISRCTSNGQSNHNSSINKNNDQIHDFSSTEGHSKLQLKVKRQRNVVSESKRRKQMTRLFYTLRSLLPVEIPQNNRCWVIEETCAYIRDLQKQLQHLKLKKGSILLTNKSTQSHKKASPCGAKEDDANNLKDEQSMSFAPEDLYVRITCVEKRDVKIILGCHERGPSRSFSTILNILETQGLDIVTANRSQAQDVVLYAIHARYSSSTTPNIEELEKLLYEVIASISS